LKKEEKKKIRRQTNKIRRWLSEGMRRNSLEERREEKR